MRAGQFVLRVQVPTLKLATVLAKGIATDIEIRVELQEDEEAVLASNEADSLDLRVTFPAPVEEDIDMTFKAGLLTVSFAKQVQQKRMRITLKVGQNKRRKRAIRILFRWACFGNRGLRDILTAVFLNYR
ncbi:hypothetical protein HDU89_005728 [Geranomyces variabilis]|nr:hypothetical protein HDU89_005728 [Geranomyces variabilis]